MQVDILVLAAHPDDAELACSGTILKQIDLGYKVAIVDLTQGERGTRGTIETRKEEAAAASAILGVSARENLGLPDCFLENSQEHQLRVIYAIRKYRPQIVLCNATEDRHPDHGKAAKLISDACFLAGLQKIETSENDKLQAAWRPKVVYHYIQDRYIKPDFVVDITEFAQTKMEAIKAYKTQFYDPNSDEPATYIASADFLETITARQRELGKIIGVRFAEGYTVERLPGVNNLFDLI